MQNKTLIIGGRGYIGSALKQHINADSIDITDFSKWAQIRWDIEGYETIILLAGHSSAQLSKGDPNGAWRNNVNNFKNLLDSLDEQRLIYASSGSVYNGIKAEPKEDVGEFHPLGMYDVSKHAIDQLALLSDKHFYGLRFATVNGYSPTLRIDLMLNKMVEDAKTKGVVTIKNANLKRPILGMQDLCRAVKTIVDSKGDNRGIYNLCTLHDCTVGDYARAVTEMFGGRIEDLGEEPHYVFGLDTTKFETTYDFKFKDSLESILLSLKQEPERKVIRA